MAAGDEVSKEEIVIAMNRLNSLVPKEENIDELMNSHNLYADHISNIRSHPKRRYRNTIIYDYRYLS